MTSGQGVRRGAAAVVAVAVALVATPAAARPFAAPPAQVGAHGVSAPGHQVAAARAATEGYTHPPAARRSGYALLKDAEGIACIAMPGMGGMGVHYANTALVDDTVSATEPEALVYRFTRNGHLRLAALEYLVLRSVWRQTHPTGRPRLFGTKFDLTRSGNRFGLPAYFSLHAWLWYPSPAGRYQGFNPDVHCPPGI